MPNVSLDDVLRMSRPALSWIPEHWCEFNEEEWRGLCGGQNKSDDCKPCRLARLTADDVRESINDALRDLRNNANHNGRQWMEWALRYAEMAAKFARHHEDEPNAVSIFRNEVLAHVTCLGFKP